MNNDLISREDLRNYARKVLCADSVTNTSLIRMFDEIIDNAPTVELDENVIQEVLNKRCMTVVANEYLVALHGKRPQGECKTCRHRDPEDKKCDCGGLERQGCQFPVSDDYFCKFYEKGGADMRKGGRE